jgi:hypothetical protein
LHPGRGSVVDWWAQSALGARGALGPSNIRVWERQSYCTVTHVIVALGTSSKRLCVSSDFFLLFISPVSLAEHWFYTTT